MKLGFIGCGNMACAMLGGIIENKTYLPEEIIGADVFAPSRERVKGEFGITVTEENREVVQKADIVVLSVKPQFCEEVINSIKDDIREGQLFITIIPGKTLEWLGNKFGQQVKIVRTMPNTPAMVKEGMTGACANEYVTEEDMKNTIEILNGFGKTEMVSEKLLDVVTGVSGSSPAYVFMFIEAMADAAVAGGMPRSQGYQFAAQAVMGSAKLVLESGKHPGELKDMVCSPAGTTIGAVRVLEEKGFRSAVFEAVTEATNIAKSL
ncbi:pyrroline-5-carboxylate reductase [Lachnospiraceae bacterium OttesenSCG-928-E19]|nr:pyrroline-5-carboxylate reductase [Lachnospiraceae bacterium OttesenSCG-928-E19]